MYDFYKTQPKSKEDLHEYLTSWLVKPSTETPILEVNDDKYIQEYGFRRSFYMHCVYRNIASNEFVWWVFPDDTPEIDTFPTIRFLNYETLLEHVINDYYKSWKLVD